MPDPKTQTQGQGPDNSGAQDAQATDDGRTFTQEEVTRIAAKEKAAAARSVRAELEAVKAEAEALKAKAEEAEALRARIEELEGKGQSAEAKALALQAKKEQEWKAREAEYQRTTAALKARADRTAIKAAVGPLVAGKVAKENSPEIVEREISQHCVAKDDGSVVYHDPDTDEEIPPAQAIDAFLTSHRIFLSTPASGSGHTPGTPVGKKPIAAMNKDELEQLVNDKHSSTRGAK